MQECVSGEKKCVESGAGNFLFKCSAGKWITEKECRTGCTKPGLGGNCKPETNETLALAYGQVLAEVNSLLTDARAAFLNVSVEENELRKATEFQSKGDYASALERLSFVKKTLSDKLSRLPMGRVEGGNLALLGQCGAGLACIFLALTARNRLRRRTTEAPPAESQESDRGAW
ncbi:hypothetical protein HZC09_03440 [Candidatus Micrarchaeota archaeon]|nr:hypothetical protein [Candidatus Micrarchaeota archaeon]